MRKSSLLLLLLAACGSPTGPSMQPDLEFESGIVFGIPTLPTVAVASEGMIVVTGVIPTLGSGFTLSPNLSLTAGNTLTLDINVTETATGFGFPAQNFYRARMRSLAPGDYDLSVIHSIHDPSPLRRERVYHQTVRVN
jgi:hypothetical protein